MTIEDFYSKAKKKIKRILQGGEKPPSEDVELSVIKKELDGFDRDHVWAFRSGNSGQDFRGNPKYLFAYVNYYRPDIFAYWMCESEETIEQIRCLGFHAFHSESLSAGYAVTHTGVAVDEMVREFNCFDEETKYLNLWHGHGFKTCERARTDDNDEIRLMLAKKYILNNAYYQNHMILACVSSVQEKYLPGYIGVPEKNILRTGYVRNTYQRQYRPVATFDHEIRKSKGLPDGTRLAVYAPTFRADSDHVFTSAFPDLEELYRCCEQNRILLIFKMHPHPKMEKENGFLRARETYSERPYFLFWDNRNDLYEIISRIDLLIYDYSSIFNDFLLGGVKHYIRYIFDSNRMTETANVNNEEEYYRYTCGTVCKSFEELLSALEHFDENDEREKIQELKRLQWEYAGEDDCEKIIRFTMGFQIGHVKYPTLYSFDIFDTLISREGLEPESIFFAVKERMSETGGFEPAVADCYPQLRMKAEAALRDYMNKSRQIRNTFRTEIKLEQIFRYMKDLFGFTDEQAECLKQWEIEAEVEAVVPLPEQIRTVKHLLEQKETVVLISDMYLPEETIRRMLKKADPVLGELPIFLSSQYGVLKSNGLLFFEVYRSFKPYYSFGKWLHVGDNANGDQNQPRRLNICTRLCSSPRLNGAERYMVEKLNRYDGFLTAAMQARLREEYSFEKADFIIDIVAPLLVSYVDWMLRDALEKGFETLYFVARDGYHLQRIADAMIKVRQWPIRTKYLYASRKSLKVPSFIDGIDESFWLDNGGHFNGICSKEEFLKAAEIDSAAFRELIPYVDLDQIDFADRSHGQPGRELAQEVLRYDQAYRTWLLAHSEKERGMVCGYLRQEINPDEKFAFVEFWGGGYTQECLSRLWNVVNGREVSLYYYYARSRLFTEGNCVRFNMVADNREPVFMEVFFENMPYHSVSGYEIKDGRIVPVLEPKAYDKGLLNTLENILPEYARRYAGLHLRDASWDDRRIFYLVLDYYYGHQTDPEFSGVFNGLMYQFNMHDEEREFARPITMEDIENIQNKVPKPQWTMSVPISYVRSEPQIREKYNAMYQIETGDSITGKALLSRKQIAENKNYRIKTEHTKERAEHFGEQYKRACEKYTVEDLAVLLSTDKGFGDAFYSLERCLEKQDRLAVEKFSAADTKGREEELAVLLARCRYIIMNGNVPLMSGLRLRTDTECIMIRSSAFTLYKKGYRTSYKLRWRERYERSAWNMPVTASDLPGEAQRNVVPQSCYKDPRNVKQIRGALITDVYFDEEYKKHATETLKTLFPAVNGKKVILYMPDLRVRERDPGWYELLDVRRLQELVGDEYVVAADTRNKKNEMKTCRNELEVPGFCRLMNSGIRLRELAAAADVIVGDYRDTLFECVLLGKPVYFTGFDCETKMKDTNMAYPLADINPFPVLRTAEELADQLLRVEEYDFTPLKAFQKRYLEFCDGHGAERLTEYMVQDRISI